MLCLLGPGDLALVAAIVSVAACAQMVSGFGFALMAVPLMGLAIDLKTAVVISTICGTASNTYQAINAGHDRDPRLVRVLTTTSFLGMPLGFVLLDRIDVDFLRVVIGIVVLVALLAVLRSSSGVALGGRFLEVLAGFVSGVLATSTSTNGPPLVLLLRARGLSRRYFAPPSTQCSASSLSPASSSLRSAHDSPARHWWELWSPYRVSASVCMRAGAYVGRCTPACFGGSSSGCSRQQRSVRSCRAWSRRQCPGPNHSIQASLSRVR